MIRKIATAAAPAAHRLWRLFPPVKRRQILGQVGAWLAPRPDAVPPPVSHGLAVGGELMSASGVGETARLMLKAAEIMHLPAWPVNTPPLVDAAATFAAQADDVPPAAIPLVMHVNAPQLPLAALRLPRSLLRNRHVIGYWAWELPSTPLDWRVGLPFIHEVWVPSQFTATALEPLLPGQIRVVPMPLSAVPPVPAALNRSAFGLPENAVIVLVSFNLASSFVQNPLAAISAFRAAFGDRADRLLVLKVGHSDHFPNDFMHLAAAAEGPNIRLETRTLSTAESHALTAAADIVLSLHRSEGFGLVPAEAMLLGKPVIATGWSGNMDYMDGASAALVTYKLIPTEDPRRVYRDSVWAEPDIASAVTHLRRLADNAAARHALGIRAKETARKHLGMAPLLNALRNIGLSIDMPSQHKGSCLTVEPLRNQSHCSNAA